MPGTSDLGQDMISNGKARVGIRNMEPHGIDASFAIEPPRMGRRLH